MATKKPVNSGSTHCRDCGGPTTTWGGHAWCENTAPKPDCANLTAYDRVHCEKCGQPHPGPSNCPHCGAGPTFP